MHPVLFKIPGLDWPVRLFGLFIIDGFFVAALWLQWQYARRRDPAFAGDEGVARAFRILLFGIVGSRIAWLVLPGIGWTTRVVGVLAVDYLLAGFVWARLLRSFKTNENARKEADFIFNLAFWLLLVGFLGARLFWIATTPEGQKRFLDSPLNALFFIWDGGIVYYGGLICAAAFGVWYLWWKDRPVLPAVDLLSVGVPLSLFVGRWACFCAGCDYGRPTDAFPGVVFPVDRASQIPEHLQGTTALHPAQLYCSLNGLVIFLILLLVLRRKRFEGQVFYLLLMLYPVGRSLIEMYRGDASRGVYEVFGQRLSTSQIISIPVFLLALFLYLRGYLKSRGEKPVSAAT